MNEDQIKYVKITMGVTIKNKDIEALKRIEHHVEELVDLDSWPEILNIYQVTVREEVL